MKRLLTLALCLLPSLAWGNDYYTHGSFPAAGSVATSAGMRAELDLITAGFNKLPTLTGNANKILVVDGAGTGITTTAGTITVPTAFTITGAYALTLALTGTTSLTLPTSGTVATLTGTEVFTNKSLTAPAISSPTISGSATFSSAGAHSFGATQAAAQMNIGGTWAGSGASTWGFHMASTLTPAANGSAHAFLIEPTITEAASGTHGMFSTMYLLPPTINAGAATVTDAITLRIGGAPTNATSNYALFVDNGSVYTGGGYLKIGVSGVGGSNPSLYLNDGTSDAQLQMVAGNLNHYNLGHINFSPGLAEKVRFSTTGNVLIGTNDETSIAGGIGMIGGLKMAETYEPATPPSNNLVLYSADDGSGNTVLAVKFATGSPVTLARENVGITPPGTVAMYAKSSAVAPSGWLLADGSAVSRTTYAALFASVGTTFGSGDGSTTFNVPTIANYATNIRFIIKC